MPAPEATVTVVLSSQISDGAVDVIPHLQEVTCDVNGNFTGLTVLANDDASTIPQGSFYTVTIIDAMGAELDTFKVQIPKAVAPSVDLFSLTRIGASAPGASTPQFVTSVEGLSGSLSFGSPNGSVTISTSGNVIELEATSNSAPVSSVFGRTGAVVAATGDYTVSQITGAAPLASPALTGTPTAPTPATGNNSTSIATTAFVQTAIAAVSTGVTSVFGRTGAVTAATGDYSVGQVTGAAPLASPAFTGTPTAPTATALTNDTQIATTAYSDAAVAVEKARALAAEATYLPLAGGTMTGPIVGFEDKGGQLFNVKAYGAKGDGTTDDTAAINAAVADWSAHQAGYVYFPAGTYIISSALNWKITGLVVRGAGQNISTIEQTGVNMPIVQVAGSSQEVSGLCLKYNTQRPYTETNSAGMTFGDNTVGSSFASDFHDLLIENVCDGLAIDPTVSSVAGLFSCVFTNIRILGYSNSAIRLVGSNGSGANATGCVFSNIYTHNNAGGSDSTTCHYYPVFLEYWDEVVFNQLNIEHGTSPTQDLLALVYVGSATFNGLHFEDYTLSADTHACIYLHQSKLLVNSGTCRFCTFSGATSNPIVRLYGTSSPSTVEINGWTDDSNTVTTPSRPFVDVAGAYPNVVRVSGADLGQTTTTVANATSSTLIDFSQNTAYKASLYNAHDYGAKGDTQHVTDGAMTASSAVLTSASNKFASTDVGKTIMIAGAGTSGATLETTIASYQSAGQVTLTAAAATTVSAAGVYWGTDDTTAINNAMTAAMAVGGICYFPPAMYLITNRISISAPVRIRGAGSSQNAAGAAQASTIVSAGGSAGTNALFWFGHTATAVEGCEIDHLALVYWGTLNVVDDMNTQHTYFHDLQITITSAGAAAFYAVSGEGTTNNSVIDCMWERVSITTTAATRTAPMISISSNNGGAIADNTFLKCYFNNAGKDTTQPVLYVACTGTGSAWHYATTVRDCYFEMPLGGAIKSLSGLGLLVDHCVFWDMHGLTVGNSIVYVGEYSTNTNAMSAGVRIVGCGRNRSSVNGTSVWDIECEATTTQVEVTGYFVMPDAATTQTDVYFNFHGCSDVILANNVTPLGSSVNGNSTTVVTNPSPSQVELSSSGTQVVYVPAPTGNATTDTANINAAIALAKSYAGAVIQFQAGTYVTNGNHNIGGGYPGGLVVQGRGWNTEVQLANASNVYIFTFGGTYTPGAIVRDMYLQCNGANQTTGGGGIYGYGAVRCLFDHLWIDSPYNEGLYLYQNGSGAYGQHNTVSNNLFTGGSSAGAGGTGYGLRTAQSDENKIFANNFQDNGVNGNGHSTQFSEEAGLQHIFGNSFTTVSGSVGCSMLNIAYSQNNVIIGNVFDGGNNANAQLHVNGDNNQITANRFYNIGAGATGTTGVPGLYLDQYTWNTVTSNVFAPAASGAAQCGILFGNGADYGTVADNTFNAHDSGGIWLAGDPVYASSTTSAVHTTFSNNNGYTPFVSSATTSPTVMATRVELGALSMAQSQDFATVGRLGMTHTHIPVIWQYSQSTSGGAVTPNNSYTGVPVATQIAAAKQAGLQVTLEPQIHYPPTWAQVGGSNPLPQFQNQQGTLFQDTTPGYNVFDWIWDTRGWSAVSSFLTGLCGALDLTQIDTIKIGGGITGELQYPLTTGAPNGTSWTTGSGGPWFWSFGATPQSGGANLESDQTVCPTGTYVYGSGNTANDASYAAWYVGSLAIFMKRVVNLLRSNGFQGKIAVMLPSYGARSAWGLQSSSYAGQIAQGTRFEDVLSVMATLPDVYPHCTWIDGADNGAVTPGQANSNPAAWRYMMRAAQEIYSAAGVELRMSGENTSQSITAAQFEAVFQTGAMANGYQGFYLFDWPTTLKGNASLQKSVKNILDIRRQNTATQQGIGFCIYQNTAQALVNGASNTTPVSLDTIDFDTAGFASGTGPWTTFTVPAGCGGLYLLEGQFTLANIGTTAGFVAMSIGYFKSGQTISNGVLVTDSGPVPLNSNQITACQGKILKLLNDGDSIYLRAYQSTASSQNSQPGEAYVRLSASRIGGYSTA